MDAAATTTGTAEKPKPQNPQAIQYNLRILTYTRSMLAAIAGAAAGILGLQGILGFLFYGVASLLLSGALVLLSAEMTPAKFLPSWWMVATHEVGGSLFSYVLFWTLVFGLVHVYD
ncbi:transmembrane protein 93 [Chytridium lagenaria]|nr:transmembrane protein 93 [Chytridium lagenaria]